MSEFTPENRDKLPQCPQCLNSIYPRPYDQYGNHLCHSCQWAGAHPLESPRSERARVKMEGIKP